MVVFDLMGILSRHKKEKEIAEKYFKSVISVRCPYFKQDIIFNSDGFHHLQFSDGKEREKAAQLLKFNLLPLATDVIKSAGTIQEYRRIWGKVGRKQTGKFQKLKEIEYWGLIAITKDNTGKMLKVKVILRRVGNGNITFWSIMPVSHSNKDTYHLSTGNLSDD